MGQQPKPAETDHPAAYYQGHGVDNEEVNQSEVSFVGLPIMAQLLSYHDIVKHNLYDLAHQFGNMIKHIFSFIRHTQGQKARFGGKKREV